MNANTNTGSKSFLAFTLLPTLTNSYSILNQPQLLQHVGVQAIKQYQFCVPEGIPEITAYIQTITDACTCPGSYAKLDLVISKKKPIATIRDISWKIESDSVTGTLNLGTYDRNTRPGTYYMNVIGTCDASCEDMCICGPCSNLQHSKFGLLVAKSDDFYNIGKTMTTMNSPIMNCGVTGIVGKQVLV